jgi:hypothetical protein
MRAFLSAAVAAPSPVGCRHLRCFSAVAAAIAPPSVGARRRTSGTAPPLIRRWEPAAAPPVPQHSSEFLRDKSGIFTQFPIGQFLP